MKTATSILTMTLPTGETVLAKSPTEPLRYGNLSAAQKKLDSIQLLISSARSASIVKQDGRFLVMIYDSPGYQSISLDDIESMMLKRQTNSGSGYIFATTSGIRSNPRNRHNHQNESQTDIPYRFET